jgi:zinc transport system ATP-binding protein
MHASAANTARKIAVRYRDVSFAYDTPAAEPARDLTPRLALEKISLDVLEGERLGILGPNGGGKSTLLKLTLGLLRGHSGSISIFDLPPDAARDAGLIGYVPQRVESELAFPLSARDVVAMGATVGLPAWRSLSRTQRDLISNALEVVGAAALADRPIGQLSGGQIQRVMIARALARQPRLLLLDEPTVGIDVVGQQQFAELLTALHDRLGVTIMVVSHDLRTVTAGCDRVACLSRTLHSHTDPQGVTPAVLAEVFRHDVAALFGDLHVDAHRATECAHHHDHGHDHGHAHDHAHAPKPTGDQRP